MKNKVAPPFAEAEFDIIYNHGINKEGSILDVGIEAGVVEKKGAWLQFEGELIGQGKEAAQKALVERPRAHGENPGRHHGQPRDPAARMMTEQIVILDFGSQYTQVIARRVRECNVFSVILPYNIPASEIAAMAPRGMILSGGPSSVYAREAPLPDPALLELPVPLLGICYGVQILAHFLGGKVEPGLKREYGKGTLRVKDSFCPLFANLPESLQVWNSHGDKLTRLPNGFKSVAVTENSDFAAIEDHEGKRLDFSFTRRSPTPPTAAKSLPTSSTTSAAAARTGRCATTLTRPSKPFAARSARKGSSSA